MRSDSEFQRFVHRRSSAVKYKHVRLVYKKGQNPTVIGDIYIIYLGGIIQKKEKKKNILNLLEIDWSAFCFRGHYICIIRTKTHRIGRFCICKQE